MQKKKKKKCKIEYGKKTSKNRTLNIASPICPIQLTCNEKDRVGCVDVCLNEPEVSNNGECHTADSIAKNNFRSAIGKNPSLFWEKPLA